MGTQACQLTAVPVELGRGLEGLRIGSGWLAGW